MFDVKKFVIFQLYNTTYIAICMLPERAEMIFCRLLNFSFFSIFFRIYIIYSTSSSVFSVVVFNRLPTRSKSATNLALDGSRTNAA